MFSLLTKLNRILPVYIVLSLIWLSSLSVFFLNRWNHDLDPINRTYSARTQICSANYSEPKAQKRCIQIMDLEHFQSRSIMIANRVLACTIPPLIGLGLLVYLGRRHSGGRSGEKGRPS